METKREKRVRIFLNQSGGIVGIRQLKSYFERYKIECRDKDALAIEEALKLVENINENSEETDFTAEEMDLEVIYSFLSAVEKAKKDLLDTYMDYLEDKACEEE